MHPIKQFEGIKLPKIMALPPISWVEKPLKPV
jgi:hypothetical protein